MKRLLIPAALATAIAVCMGVARGVTFAEHPAPVTFAEQVAPIIFARCVSCHRPGEAAPFALQSYDDVAKRGRLIAAVTRAGYMPPWKAEPASYRYKDERRLTREEIDLIGRWVAEGMPKGDLDRLPPVPTYPSGWRLGQPDLVLEMPKGYHVPADGPDIYRSFVIPLQLADQKWIRAIELRPSARTVVHHVLFFADASGQARRADAADGEAGFSGVRRGGLGAAALGGWAVGQQPHFYPDGIAIALPARSDLVLQYHFHPTGKPEEERSVVGLYFADRAPDRRLSAIQLPVLFGYFAGIDIPAGARNFTVDDSFVLPVDVEAVAIGAHAHYLGRTMTMTATLPDGTEKTLLSITDWDFAWQDRYVFDGFVPLPRGTRLRTHVSWDNSADNPRNPSNPPVRVRWGEQSFDEMGSVTVQVVPRQPSDFDALRRAYRRHVIDAAAARP